MIENVIAAMTPGGYGIWVLVILAAVHGIREYRLTRSMTLEDRLARRDGYAKQVETLTVENRALRAEMNQMNENHEKYRTLCHQENDQLRKDIHNLSDTVEGLRRERAQDALEILRLTRGDFKP